VSRTHLPFEGAKDSKLELNHIWSFPTTLVSSQRPPSVREEAWDELIEGVRGYYPGQP